MGALQSKGRDGNGKDTGGGGLLSTKSRRKSKSFSDDLILSPPDRYGELQVKDTTSLEHT